MDTTPPIKSPSPPRCGMAVISGSPQTWNPDITEKQKLDRYIATLDTKIGNMSKKALASFLDNPAEILAELKRLHSENKIIFGPPPGTPAEYGAYLHEQDILFLPKELGQKDFGLFASAMLFHEATHAVHYRKFIPSKPRTPEMGSAVVTMNQLVELIKKYRGLDGRIFLFTEFRAAWNGRIESGALCQGSSTRNKQIATLEEDILANPIYQNRLIAGGLCVSPCTQETHITIVGDPEAGFPDVPWTPIGKSSPWEP